MKDRLVHSHIKLASVESRLTDFRAQPFSLRAKRDPGEFSDGRDGHIMWSLYGNAGSQQVQSVGAFDARSTNFYGMEGAPPGKVGASCFSFSEEVGFMSANGTFNYQDGTTQKISGRIVLMVNGIQVWSGQLQKPGDQEFDTPASGQYYITLTIRRQHVQNTDFHLLIFPVTPAFQNGGAVSSHKLRIYNDSTNSLLSEEDLQPATDPHSQMSAIFQVSEMVPKGDFLRVELIAQISLENDHSPQTPVFGGSCCGMGFADNVS